MNDNVMPETVKFMSGEVECIAAVMFGCKCLLNMGTCLINLNEKPDVEIGDLPFRVSVNGGAIWFDTNEESALEIVALFKAVREQNLDKMVV